MRGDEVRDRAHPLSALLREGLAAGAALGFLAPIDDEELDRYWATVADEVEARRRTLIAAHIGPTLVGMAQVVRDSAPNGQHRAELQKLVVAEVMRGRGIARELLRTAERAARAEGVRLLHLSTHAQLPAAELYRGQGWHEVGRVPGWAIVPGGEAVENIFFWKPLP